MMLMDADYIAGIPQISEEKSPHNGYAHLSDFILENRDFFQNEYRSDHCLL